MSKYSIAVLLISFFSIQQTYAQEVGQPATVTAAAPGNCQTQCANDCAHKTGADYDSCYNACLKTNCPGQLHSHITPQHFHAPVLPLEMMPSSSMHFQSSTLPLNLSQVSSSTGMPYFQSETPTYATPQPLSPSACVSQAAACPTVTCQPQSVECKTTHRCRLLSRLTGRH